MKKANKDKDDYDDFDVAKMKRLPRGAFLAEPGETDRAKVRISILVDQDVLKFYKDGAKEPGALPYQTQMHEVLRRHMAAGEDGDLDRLAAKVLKRIEAKIRSAA